jgi:hypothetical protein
LLDALLVVRLHHVLRLFRFARQAFDHVTDLVRRILLTGLLGFLDGLLNMSESLLDFVCLQHDVLLALMARVRIRLEMRGWSDMVVLLGIGGRTNRIDEFGTPRRNYRI